MGAQVTTIRKFSSIRIAIATKEHHGQLPSLHASVQAFTAGADEGGRLADGRTLGDALGAARAVAPPHRTAAGTRRPLRLDRCADTLFRGAWGANSHGDIFVPSCKRPRGELQFPPPPARSPVNTGDPGTAGWARADRQPPRSINRRARERADTPGKHR
jgi:hypothetical protein